MLLTREKLLSDMGKVRKTIEDLTNDIENEKDPIKIKQLTQRKRQLQFQALFYIEYLWNLE